MSDVSLSDSEDDDSIVLMRIPRLIERWDLDEHHSVKALHEREQRLKNEFNKRNVMDEIFEKIGDKDEDDERWITVLPDGRIYMFVRACDAKRCGTSRDVSYIFKV